MWSSPVLLLVLVFTLTASSSSTPLRHSSASSPTTIVSPPTTNVTTTTTTTTTTDPARHSKTAKVSSEKVVTPVSTSASPATTSASRNASSSSATASSVEPVANAPDVNATNGVLNGRLSPSFDVADLPLAGPGTWDVASSAPVTVTLACSGATIPVESQFVIGAHEQCQVSITATNPKASLTWQLTPVP
jgi:hypothetical protein